MPPMPGSPGPASVTVQEAAELRRGDDGEGALIVDVREPNEFAQGRVEGAVLLPLGQFAARYTELPRDRKLLMLCRSGARSASATQFLAAQGFDNAANIEGGMIAWHNAGLPMKSGLPEPGEGDL
jgi:rhodanese-related sulfurtransferase